MAPIVPTRHRLQSSNVHKGSLLVKECHFLFHEGVPNAKIMENQPVSGLLQKQVWVRVSFEAAKNSLKACLIFHCIAADNKTARVKKGPKKSGLLLTDFSYASR